MEQSCCAGPLQVVTEPSHGGARFWHLIRSKFGIWRPLIDVLNEVLGAEEKSTCTCQNLSSSSVQALRVFVLVFPVLCRHLQPFCCCCVVISKVFDLVGGHSSLPGNPDWYFQTVWSDSSHRFSSCMKWKGSSTPVNKIRPVQHLGG